MQHPWITSIATSTDIAPTTKRQYISNLQSLLKILGPSASLEIVVSKPQTILSQLNKEYQNDQTKKSMIASIKALYKHVPEIGEKYKQQSDIYHDAFHALDRSILSRVSSAIPTQREIEGWIDWNQILQKQKELQETSYGSIEHLLLSMYTLIEPIRADYGTVKITNRAVPMSVRTGNYLSLMPSHAELVLNEYKTSTKYGQYRRTVSEDLVNIIRTSLRQQPREYLFVNDKGLPFASKNSFGKFVNRYLYKIFGKTVTIRLLRHSFISCIDFNETTPKQLFQYSKNMMHSIAQQQMYRRKVTPIQPSKQKNEYVQTKSSSHAQPQQQQQQHIIQQQHYTPQGQERYLTFQI